MEAVNQIPFRVLVVDDSDFDRALLSRFVRTVGNFTSVEASSGEECLEKLKAESFDLVLMDFNMKGLTGLEALVEIRKSHSSIALPVIMVTGNQKAEDVVRSLKAGANDYLTKPIDMDIATARILIQMELRQLSRAQSRLHELEAMRTMMVTFNHEINTPLAVALLNLDMDPSDEKVRQRLRKSINEVASVLKKLTDVINKSEVEVESYIGGSAKVIKIPTKS